MSTNPVLTSLMKTHLDTAAVTSSISAPNSERRELFSKEFCRDLVAYLDTLEDTWWYKRYKINSIPTKGVVDCTYKFLGHMQMDPEFRKFLFKIAPKIDLTWLGEVVINKYEIGEGMPEHIDQALYRYNMVVSLNDHGDGITIEGKFVEDKPGWAVIFPARSVPHEVPPVKTRRYVLIFLYE